MQSHPFCAPSLHFANSSLTAWSILVTVSNLRGHFFGVPWLDTIPPDVPNPTAADYIMFPYLPPQYNLTCGNILYILLLSPSSNQAAGFPPQCWNPPA